MRGKIGEYQASTKGSKDGSLATCTCDSCPPQLSTWINKFGNFSFSFGATTCFKLVSIPFFSFLLYLFSLFFFFGGMKDTLKLW